MSKKALTGLPSSGMSASRSSSGGTCRRSLAMREAVSRVYALHTSGEPTPGSLFLRCSSAMCGRPAPVCPALLPMCGVLLAKGLAAIPATSSRVNDGESSGPGAIRAGGERVRL